MKVVYMGTPDFAVGPLQAMLCRRCRSAGSRDTAGQTEGQE